MIEAKKNMKTKGECHYSGKLKGPTEKRRERKEKEKKPGMDSPRIRENKEVDPEECEKFISHSEKHLCSMRWGGEAWQQRSLGRVINAGLM